MFLVSNHWKFLLNFYTLGDIFNCTYPSKSCHFHLPLGKKKQKKQQHQKHLITKKCIPPGILCSTVPANVPISVKTSGPQVLTGPKASGWDKRFVNASVCCSVQGRDASRRNRTAMLQFEGTHSGLKPPLRICKMFSRGLCCWEMCTSLLLVCIC